MNTNFNTLFSSKESDDMLRPVVQQLHKALPGEQNKRTRLEIIHAIYELIEQVLTKTQTIRH